MSLSKYSKRRGQFEALEAKQLFAADFVGGAAADLPDTAMIAKPDNTEGYRCFSCGLCGDYQMPAANLPQISTDTLTATQSFENEERESLHTAAHEAAHLTHQFGGQEGEPIADPVLDRVLENLGGQEGEPIIDPISDMVLENLGGQEGEPITEESAPVASIAPDGCVDLIGGAAIDLPDTAIVAENISEDDFVIIPLNVRTDLGGQEGEDIARQVTGVGNWSPVVVKSELTGPIGGTLDRTPTVIDPVDCPELGGQEGEPIIDPNDCPMSLVDHVFQDYARDDFQITDQHYFAVR